MQKDWVIYLRKKLERMVDCQQSIVMDKLPLHISSDPQLANYPAINPQEKTAGSDHFYSELPGKINIKNRKHSWQKE